MNVHSLIRRAGASLLSCALATSLTTTPAFAAGTVHFDVRRDNTFSPSERNSRTTVFITGLNPFRGEAVTKTVNSTPAGQNPGTPGSQQNPTTPQILVVKEDACNGTTADKSLPCLQQQVAPYTDLIAELGQPLTTDSILTVIDRDLRSQAALGAQGDPNAYQKFVEGAFAKAKQRLTLIAASKQRITGFEVARKALKAAGNDTSSVDDTIAALQKTEWTALIAQATDLLAKAAGFSSQDFFYQDTESCNTGLSSRTTRYAVVRDTKEVAGLLVRCKTEWYGGGIYVFSKLDTTTYSVGQSSFLASPAPTPTQNVIIASNNVNVRRFTQPVGHYCPAKYSFEHAELCLSISPAIQTGNTAYGGGDGVLFGTTVLTLNRALGLSGGLHYGQVNELQKGYHANSQLLPGTSIDQVLTHPYRWAWYWGIVFSAPAQ
jgi:hypothetical protein